MQFARDFAEICPSWSRILHFVHTLKIKKSGIHFRVFKNSLDKCLSTTAPSVRVLKCNHKVSSRRTRHRSKCACLTSPTRDTTETENRERVLSWPKQAVLRNNVCVHFTACEKEMRKNIFHFVQRATGPLLPTNDHSHLHIQREISRRFGIYAPVTPIPRMTRNVLLADGFQVPDPTKIWVLNACIFSHSDCESVKFSRFQEILVGGLV